MDVWVPSSIKPDTIKIRLQKWLDETTKHAYQNIIQDRVNSLYPTLAEHKTLYILTVSPQRIITLELSPFAPPVSTAVTKMCAICYEEDTVVRHTLACNHTFHLHCIEKWLLNKRTCPMCRYKVY
jgi:hypothetical protein